MWWRLGEVGVMPGEVVGRTTPATRIGTRPGSLLAALAIHGHREQAGNEPREGIDTVYGYTNPLFSWLFSDPITMLTFARDAYEGVERSRGP